jgi:SAM-dependent methyltransferase
VPKYDSIGRDYRPYRVADPRIAQRIHAALGDNGPILNIGAGAGSYEPENLDVVALEPSRVMLAQRGCNQAPAVQGVAESLPFADDTFAASLGVLTLHHWENPAAGLNEALRVGSGKLVLFSWAGFPSRFWLFDYFPEIETIDQEIFPSLQWMAEVTGAEVRSEVVPVPADCSDGFLCAYWRRPEAYLDDGVRGAISTFPRLENVESRLQDLREDLASGAWRQRHGNLLSLQDMDFGYRVIVLERQ